MVTVKVHVREGRGIILRCPFCGVVKHIVVDKIRHTQHPLGVRCRCQQIFTVQLEFRQHFRKQTDLPGVYVIVDQDGDRIGGGLLRIKDISMTGLSFTVSGRHRIQKDQELRLEFQLNDKKKNMVNKQALVKSTQRNTIGCQFKDAHIMERNLGFFMRS